MNACHTMKLIIVVKSKNRPKTFANTTLKYISRAGYDYRIYVKRSQKKRYLDAIAYAKVDHYLFVPEEDIKIGAVRIPKKYNLVLYVPDNLKGFTDKKLLLFCREVGSMRTDFGKHKAMLRLENKSINAYMIRL